MQHVLWDRHIRLALSATVQVMPRCVMLDSLGRNAPELHKLFFRQLPLMLTEFMRFQWLIVDVKASNFGFHGAEHTLVLVDMESVVQYQGDGSSIPKPWIHTPGYSAPECCTNDEAPVTLKSDVYAFGKLCREMSAYLDGTQRETLAVIITAATQEIPAQRPDMNAFIQMLADFSASV